MTNIASHSVKKYSRLVDEQVVYTFTIGRKDQSKDIVLHFSANEFSHLAGIHYLKDIEFPSPKSEEIFLLIRDNVEYQEKILNSNNLPYIQKRLTHLEHLEDVLNHPDDIVVWEQRRARFYTNLKTDYLFSRRHDGVYDVFGIMRAMDGRYRGNTFIVESTNKYTNGQTKWVILKIERSSKDSSETLFVHKSYSK